MSMLLYAFREREMIVDIYEACAGQRMMTSYIRIGGLADELPKDFDKRVRKFLKVMPERLNDYEKLLTRNPDFYQPHQRRGGDLRRGRHQLVAVRSDAARQRRQA